MPAARHGSPGGGHGGGQVFAFPTGGHAGFDGIGATVSTIADIPGGQGQGSMEQPAIIGQEVAGGVAGAPMAPQLPAPQAPLIPTTLPGIGGIPTPLSLGYRVATGAYSVASKVPWWVWLGVGIGATLWWTRKSRRGSPSRTRVEASDDFDSGDEYEDDEEGPIVMPTPKRRRKNPVPATTPMALVSASSWPWPPSSWEGMGSSSPAFTPPISSPFTAEADDDGTE